MDKIIIYKSALKSIAYDSSNWYINDTPQGKKDGDGLSEFKDNALNETYKQMGIDISNFTNHFKNIAQINMVNHINTDNKR